MMRMASVTMGSSSVTRGGTVPTDTAGRTDDHLPIEKIRMGRAARIGGRGTEAHGQDKNAEEQKAFHGSLLNSVRRFRSATQSDNY